VARGARGQAALAAVAPDREIKALKALLKSVESVPRWSFAAPSRSGATAPQPLCAASFAPRPWRFTLPRARAQVPLSGADAGARLAPGVASRDQEEARHGRSGTARPLSHRRTAAATPLAPRRPLRRHAPCAETPLAPPRPLREATSRWGERAAGPCIGRRRACGI